MDHIALAIAWLDQAKTETTAALALAEATIAQAEALQRIADVLENFAHAGVPVVDVSEEDHTASLAETIAAQHDANLYR